VTPAVAGVESAGDVRAGDDLHQALVIAELPRAEGLAEVGVEVGDWPGQPQLSQRVLS
jgi:hypothetical protein